MRLFLRLMVQFKSLITMPVQLALRLRQARHNVKDGGTCGWRDRKTLCMAD